ncbi:MAG: hypothetical protein ACOCQ4_00905 [bacterium]
MLDVHAQKSDDEKARLIYMEALRVIDEYKWNCKVFKREDLYDFLDVFTADTAKIANDVLPDNRLNEQLTAEQYPIKLSGNFKELSYEADVDVRYLSPITFMNDTSGYLTAYVDKFIKGKHVNYDNLYSDTLGYRFEIRFNGLRGNYRISEIKVERPHGKYGIVEASRKQLFGSNIMSNEKLIINRDTFQTDTNGQIFLKDLNNNLTIITVDENIYETEEVKIDQIGVKSENEQDKNLVKVDFKEPFLYWKTDVEYLASLPVKISDSDYDINITSNEINYNAGFKIGAILASNQWSRYTFSAGISYSKYHYQLGLMHYQKSYDATDTDGDAYERIIDLDNFKETHSLQMLSFPLTLSGDIKIYKDFSLSAGGGVRYFLPVNTSCQMKTQGQYSGYYEDLYGITFSEKGVYDFGQYTLNEKNKSLNVKNDLIAWNVNLGVKYQLTRRNSLNIDVSYLKSFDYIFQEDKKQLSPNKDNLNSLTNLEHKFLLENWLINVGYLMKF